MDGVDGVKSKVGWRTVIAAIGLALAGNPREALAEQQRRPTIGVLVLRDADQDALSPELRERLRELNASWSASRRTRTPIRSEEHTSELQSLRHLVCRLLLEKKKKTIHNKQ